jgi:hypothetical protein
MVALLPVSSFADSINLGLILFESQIPGGGAPGVNAFEIDNFTGDPLLGGNALPPDFPVVDFLTFKGSSLTVNEPGGTSSTFSLGDIGPGQFFSQPFPNTILFTSARFTATLSPTSFLLSDGTTTTASSPDISVDLLPSQGPTLTPDVDQQLISVSTVPEPGSVFLLGTGLFVFLALKRLRRVRD